jgi:hypothetical protein
MRPLAIVLVLCLLAGCEEARERPADPQLRIRLAEEMFIYQVRLDDLRTQLNLSAVRASTNLDQIQRLESAFALSGRMLEQYDATGEVDALHAGEVGRSFAGLGYEVISAKIDSSAHGQGSLIQDASNRALGGVWVGLEKEVFRVLEDAVKGLKPHTLEYQRALKEALRKLARKIQTPGSSLNRLLTQ